MVRDLWDAKAAEHDETVPKLSKIELEELSKKLRSIGKSEGGSGRGRAALLARDTRDTSMCDHVI